MIDNDTDTPEADPDAGWGDHPVEPTGKLTMGGISRAALDLMIAATVPKAEPRSDINECAEDMAAGINALGLGLDDKLVASILDGGGVYIVPCPVCSEAGINTHLLQVRKSGESYTVEVVAA